MDPSQEESVTDRDDTSETDISTDSPAHSDNDEPKRPFTKQSADCQATLVTSVRKCIDLSSGGEVVPMLARVLDRSEVQGLSDLVLDRKDPNLLPQIKQEPWKAVKIEPKPEKASIEIGYDRPGPNRSSSDIDDLLGNFYINPNDPHSLWKKIPSQFFIVIAARRVSEEE